MSTASIGAHTPDTEELVTPEIGETIAQTPQTPQKVGTIPGLKNTIMTALAALGIMASAEKVEGATVLIGGTLPTSTVSSSVLSPWSPANLQDIANSLYGASSINNSTTTPTNGLTGTFSSTFQVSLSAGDVGAYGGTLTVSGFYGGQATSGGPNVFNDLNSRFAYQVNGGSQVNLLSFDGPRSLNNSDTTPTIPINNPYTSFSRQINVWAGAQSIGFVNEMQLENIRTSNVRVFGNSDANQGLNFSYQKNLIPEPSTMLLAGVGIGAALLRRRRMQETPTDNT